MPAFAYLSTGLPAELAALDRAHPGWREVIGDPGETTEFRAWLDRQPMGYRIILNYTWSAEVISQALDMFQASRGPLH